MAKDIRLPVLEAERMALAFKPKYQQTYSALRSILYQFGKDWTESYIQLIALLLDDSELSDEASLELLKIIRKFHWTYFDAKEGDYYAH